MNGSNYEDVVLSISTSGNQHALRAVRALKMVDKNDIRIKKNSVNATGHIVHYTLECRSDLEIEMFQRDVRKIVEKSFYTKFSEDVREVLPVTDAKHVNRIAISSSQSGFTIEELFLETTSVESATHERNGIPNQCPHSRINIVDNTATICDRLKNKERNIHKRNATLTRTVLEKLSMPLEHTDELHNHVHQATLGMLHDIENSTTYWKPDLLNALAYHLVENVMKPKKNIDAVSSGRGSVIVVGDTHGQFYDVLFLLEKLGLPSATNKYIFNGDFVDRGNMSVELILLLLSLVTLFPEGVHLVRGNHESRAYNIFHELHELNTAGEKQVNVSFITDMKRKFGWSLEQKEDTKKIIGCIHSVFDWLPLGIVVNSNILVTHGGFSSKEGYIEKINEKHLRGSDIVFDNVGTSNDVHDMTWFDALPDKIMKSREGGKVMSQTQFQRYMRLNKLKLHLRSHQVAFEGVHHNNAYDFVHDGIERKMLTVFSAPKYCNSYDNAGGYILITSDETKYYQFKGVHYCGDDDTKNDETNNVEMEAKYFDVGLLSNYQLLLMEQAIKKYEQNVDKFGT